MVKLWKSLLLISIIIFSYSAFLKIKTMAKKNHMAQEEGVGRLAADSDSDLLTDFWETS